MFSNKKYVFVQHPTITDSKNIFYHCPSATVRTSQLSKDFSESSVIFNISLHTVIYVICFQVLQVDRNLLLPWQLFYIHRFKIRSFYWCSKRLSDLVACCHCPTKFRIVHSTKSYFRTYKFRLAPVVKANWISYNAPTASSWWRVDLFRGSPRDLTPGPAVEGRCPTPRLPAPQQRPGGLGGAPSCVSQAAALSRGRRFGVR